MPTLRATSSVPVRQSIVATPPLGALVLATPPLRVQARPDAPVRMLPTLDVVQVGPAPNLVANGDFLAYPIMPGTPPGWIVAGTVTLEQETVVVPAGATTAIKATRAVVGGTSGFSQTLVGLVVGRTYRFTYAVRPGGAYSCHIKVRNTTDNVDLAGTTNGSTTPGAYATVSWTITPAAGKTYQLQAHVDFGGPIGSFGYFSLVRVQELLADDTMGLNSGQVLAGGTNAVGPTLGGSGLYGGRAYTFDGVDDYVRAPYPFAGKPDPTEYSLESLFFWTGGGGGADGRKFICEGSGVDASPWAMNQFVLANNGWQTDASLYAGAAQTTRSVVLGANQITANAWHHALTTFKLGQAQGLKFYLEGAAAGTPQSTVGFDRLARPTNLNVGTYRGNDNRWFAGRINVVRVYGKELSAADAAYLNAEWKAGRRPMRADLPVVAEWLFQE